MTLYHNTGPLTDGMKKLLESVGIYEYYPEASAPAVQVLDPFPFDESNAPDEVRIKSVLYRRVVVPAAQSADAVDAKRYRLLRDQDRTSTGVPFIAFSARSFDFEGKQLTGKEADAATDAALSQSAAAGEPTPAHEPRWTGQVPPKSIQDTSMHSWADGAKAYALGWNECRLAILNATEGKP